jgi:hypothetical protein
MDENTGKNPIDNLRPRFTSDNQPSPEAKKRGWAMKKAREVSLEDFTEINFKWKFEEIRELMGRYKNDKTALDGFTANEVKAIFYAWNKKNAEQHFDRMGIVSKKEIDITSNDETIGNAPNMLSEILDELRDKRQTGHKEPDKPTVQG